MAGIQVPITFKMNVEGMKNVSGAVSNAKRNLMQGESLGSQASSSGAVNSGVGKIAGGIGQMAGSLMKMAGVAFTLLAILQSSKMLIRVMEQVGKIITIFLRPIGDMLAMLIIPLMAFLRPIAKIFGTIWKGYRKEAMTASRDAQTFFKEGMPIKAMESIGNVFSTFFGFFGEITLRAFEPALEFLTAGSFDLDSALQNLRSGIAENINKYHELATSISETSSIMKNAEASYNGLLLAIESQLTELNKYPEANSDYIKELELLRDKLVSSKGDISAVNDLWILFKQKIDELPIDKANTAASDFKTIIEGLATNLSTLNTNLEKEKTTMTTKLSSISESINDFTKSLSEVANTKIVEKPKEGNLFTQFAGVMDGIGAELMGVGSWIGKNVFGADNPEWEEKLRFEQERAGYMRVGYSPEQSERFANGEQTFDIIKSSLENNKTAVEGVTSSLGYMDASLNNVIDGNGSGKCLNGFKKALDVNIISLKEEFGLNQKNNTEINRMTLGIMDFNVSIVRTINAMYSALSSAQSYASQAAASASRAASAASSVSKSTSLTKKVNDLIITSDGRTFETAPDDNIFATKGSMGGKANITLGPIYIQALDGNDMKRKLDELIRDNLRKYA